jgi:hypothetical protein
VRDQILYDPALVARVISLGREGRSRAEIAVELGVSLERLAAWADDHPDLAAGPEHAATEARAWWDKLPREAVSKDGVFHAAVWSRTMAQRFGSTAHRTPDAADPEAPPRPRVRIKIPPNGRDRHRSERAGG